MSSGHQDVWFLPSLSGRWANSSEERRKTMCGRARCTVRVDDVGRACGFSGPLRTLDSDRSVFIRLGSVHSLLGSMTVVENTNNGCCGDYWYGCRCLELKLWTRRRTGKWKVRRWMIFTQFRSLRQGLNVGEHCRIVRARKEMFLNVHALASRLQVCLQRPASRGIRQWCRDRDASRMGLDGVNL